MSNNLLSIVGKNLPKKTTKYLLVALTEYDKCKVANIMDLSNGNVVTKTLWNTGKVVHHLSANPKRVSKTLKLASGLLK